ncbi:hypothetical protein B0H14DRAFT_2902362 [Mycena olivaceomarginata]|nr:hypothetical protein B0H14DRAFT_2902362 [Mycena olivaceomarginata]
MDRGGGTQIVQNIEILDWTLHEKITDDRGEDEDDPMDSSSENGSEPKAKGQRRDDENNSTTTRRTCNGEPPSTARPQREESHVRVAQRRDPTHQESGPTLLWLRCARDREQVGSRSAQVTELNVRMAEMSNRMDAFVIQRDTERDDLLTALLPPLCPPPVGSRDELWEKLQNEATRAVRLTRRHAQYLQHNEETEFKGIPLSCRTSSSFQGCRRTRKKHDEKFHASSLPDASPSSCWLSGKIYGAAGAAAPGSLLPLRTTVGQFCYRNLRASAARPDIYLWHRIKDATPHRPPQRAAADIYPRNVPGKRKEHRKKWKR